jgi:hypothetical protein
MALFPLSHNVLEYILSQNIESWNPELITPTSYKGKPISHHE